jgi:hypothetical protein
MDIDTIHHISQGYLFANSVLNNLTSLTNNNISQQNNYNMNNFNLSLMNINSSSSLKEENGEKKDQNNS